MKSYNESYSENDSENDSNGNNQSYSESYSNGNNQSENNGNGNNEDEGNGNNQSEGNVYWCFGEASEQEGWVIKLDLTTPVKFQEKVKFSLSLSTLNILRLFISLHYQLLTLIIMKTNKPLLLVAIILMMPAIILALKVEPTSDEQITAVVFGILSAIVSYLSRD